jgi:hypothetical protein
VIFFALYNSNGNHGIYRINGYTNQIDTVIAYPFLNFQNSPEYNVSFAAIDGLLYWTDNVNQPCVINVEKGIRTMSGSTVDVYIDPYRVQNYTQIKRPPGVVPDVYRLYGTGNPPVWYIINTKWNAEQASSDYQLNPNTYSETGFGNENGFQFSYYYIYDNNEESRLAPWSDPVFWKKNIVVQVPRSEFNDYFLQLGIIKKVVFVFRINNDGIPYVIRSVDNIFNNFHTPSAIPNYTPKYGQVVPGLQDGYSVVDFPDTETIQVVVPDLNNIAKTLLPSNVFDQRFDSVPLVSKTNTIAQNRLIHGNYILDRGNWSGLNLEVVVENVNNNNISGDGYISTLQDSTQKIFIPGGLYEVGIELLDEYGRPIGVINNQQVTIPNPRIAVVNVYGKTSVDYFNSYDDMVYNCYRLKYKITGTFPSWAKYCRIVSTKVKNVNYSYRGMAITYYWYQANDGSNICILYNYYNAENIPIPNSIKDLEYNKSYEYKGIAIEKTNIPVVYSAEENLYIRIAQEYSKTIASGTPVEMQEFKVESSQGNLLFVSMPQSYFASVLYNGLSLSANPVVAYSSLWYNIEVFSKKSVVESIYYQSSEIIENPSLYTTIEGYVVGDCYNTAFKKTYTPGNYVVGVFNNVLTPGGQLVTQGFVQKFYYPKPLTDFVGTYISMNPSNAYAQTWVWSQGQENVVNENQREVKIQQGLIFSDPILQGTQTNGLNKFVSVDYRLAPAENGPITSIVTTNATQREPGVLLAIGTFGISSFYYDAVQLTNVDGSSNVTTTDAFLASQRPLLGQYGTSRPMSISKTPLSTVYWWSDVVNDMIRYSNAGVERLGLTYSFSNFLRKEYNDNPFIISWYDQVTDEISFLGADVRTSVFSERYKTFQGTRDYTATGGIYPDRAIGIATKMFYILEGRVWVSDIDTITTPKNFIFGEYKNPSLTIVTNESPVSVKRWNQIKLFGDKPTTTTLSTTGFQTLNAESLVSYIEPGWWIQRKGDWEAAIRRASNTDGGVLSGKLMESRILYSNFAFTADGFQKINFIEVRSNVSIVQ